jgi:Helix-turn-helix domain
MKPCKYCGSTIRGRHHFASHASITPEEEALLAPLVLKLGVGIANHGVTVGHLTALARMFWNAEAAKFMLRENDRSFEVIVGGNNDKQLKVSFVSRDSGGVVMTTQDVAEFLRIDRDAVRRLCGERAQAGKSHPFPFIKVSEKMIRFNRPDVEKWAGVESTNGTETATGRSMAGPQRLRFLARFFESDIFQKWIGRRYDRTFEVIVDEQDRKIRLRFKRNDSHHSIMTVDEVAEFLQTDSATVRRLCQSRAQRRSHHPLPFKKFTEKTLSFRRLDVERWWGELVTSPNGKNNSRALSLVKGKQKRKR